jgi:hypothetical protein
VDSESADLDTVAAGNVFDKRGFTHDLDELLTSITILVATPAASAWLSVPQLTIC